MYTAIMSMPTIAIRTLQAFNGQREEYNWTELMGYMSGVSLTSAPDGEPEVERCIMYATGRLR